MKNKILITGGAGYVGAIVTRTFLDAGHYVTVIDNLSQPHATVQHLAHYQHFIFARADARDERIIKEIVKYADVIIPMASLVGAPLCDNDPWLAQSVNVDAVKLILKYRSDDQFIIFPTTNSGYGTQDNSFLCDENTPLQPISAYGRTKVEAEKMLLECPNVISLRLATVFGMSPAMRLNLLVNYFVWCAVKHGYIVIFEHKLRRVYVHILDVADCFLHCLENADRMVGNAYNCGLEGVNYSKGELADEVKKVLPKFYIHYAEVGSDKDKRNYSVSNKKLIATGFEPKRTVQRGILELVRGIGMMR